MNPILAALVIKPIPKINVETKIDESRSNFIVLMVLFISKKFTFNIAGLKKQIGALKNDKVP